MVDSILQDLELTGVLRNIVCAKEFARFFGIELPEHHHKITVSGVRFPVVSVGFKDSSLILGPEVNSK